MGSEVCTSEERQHTCPVRVRKESGKRERPRRQTLSEGSLVVAGVKL